MVGSAVTCFDRVDKYFLDFFLQVVIGLANADASNAKPLPTDFQTEVIYSNTWIIASLLWCIDSGNTFTIPTGNFSLLLQYLKRLGYVDSLISFSPKFTTCSLRDVLHPYLLIYFLMKRFQFFLLRLYAQWLLAY